MSLQLSAVVLFKTNEGFERLSKASEQSICVSVSFENEPQGIKSELLLLSSCLHNSQYA